MPHLHKTLLPKFESNRFYDIDPLETLYNFGTRHMVANSPASIVVVRCNDPMCYELEEKYNALSS